MYCFIETLWFDISSNSVLSKYEFCILRSEESSISLTLNALRLSIQYNFAGIQVRNNYFGSSNNYRRKLCVLWKSFSRRNSNPCGDVDWPPLLASILSLIPLARRPVNNLQYDKRRRDGALSATYWIWRGSGIKDERRTATDKGPGDCWTPKMSFVCLPPLYYSAFHFWYSVSDRRLKLRTEKFHSFHGGREVSVVGLVTGPCPRSTNTRKMGIVLEKAVTIARLALWPTRGILLNYLWPAINLRHIVKLPK